MWFHKKIDVICIGSASKDIFFPTDEGVILQTPEDITAKEKIAFELGGKYRVADRYEAIGGVAANVATGLSRLGIKSASYSCVGGDEMGRFIVDELEKEGVSTDLVTRYDDAKTDLSAIIVLMATGDRTIFHNRDANERLVVAAEKLTSDWLLVSALNGEWEKNLATIIAAKEHQGKKLAMNPGQHNIKENPKRILETLPSVDVLLLNKDEAIELLLAETPQPSAIELNDERFLLKRLHQAGAKVIGMTDGKRGSWGYDGKEYWHCPIHTRTQVIDSTGAGDAFGSGFLAAFIEGKTIPECLQYGMANSGSVVGFYGAIQGLMTPSEMTLLLPHIVPERLDTKDETERV
jgi:sugar/nucleoside kinase (ribokinase family)